MTWKARLVRGLPTLCAVTAGGLLLLHGPIAQPARYNDFADQSTWLGVPHAGDVLSNVGFALAAMWGWLRLRPERQHAALRAGWPGYELFLLGLMLTAVGSAYYHLAPDNARLVWDRIPIALTCAGLLAAVRAETRRDTNPARDVAVLAVCGVVSVGWWHYTDRPSHPGDLRPYLLLQLLPLVLIPLWQAIYRAARLDRVCFGVAVLLYVAAKLAESWDWELLSALHRISGHTLKHLIAAAAAGVLLGGLSLRLRGEGANVTPEPQRRELPGDS
jgi:hypothetical protein